MKQKSDKPSANEGLSPRTIKDLTTLTTSILGTETPPCQPQIEVNWHYSSEKSPELKAVMRLLLKGAK